MGSKAIRVREDVHRQVQELSKLEGSTMAEVVERSVLLYRKERAKQPYCGGRVWTKLVPFTRGRQA